MPTFIRSECGEDKPEAIEVTPTCVFVRKGFEQFEQLDYDGTPTGVMYWRYDEARMSHGEYAAYAAALLTDRADEQEDAIVELAALIGGE
jgi:hypothetical protein